MKIKILKIILPLVYPLNLVLPAVVYWEIREEKNVAVWAFFAGLVSDLFSGRYLGVSSLFYLGIIAFINIVRLRQKLNIVMAVIMVLVFDFIYGWFLRLF
ncbi:MAG: rod shape-determining protein MreD [bacterium]|nr:rod shape-determining protein MreD [bacterium]